MGKFQGVLHVSFFKGTGGYSNEETRSAIV